MKKITLLLIALLLSQPAAAAELTATTLQQYCNEVNKGAIGTDFDKELAQQCKGYMSAFFDSMIIVEKLTGKKEFCIPGSLPKTQNNLILSAWIDKNKNIASTTTAAVALYAAFKKAFPCP
jgi:hypothetical protein